MGGAAITLARADDTKAVQAAAIERAKQSGEWNYRRTTSHSGRCDPGVTDSDTAPNPAHR